MSISNPRNFGKELCSVLGLDSSKVRSIQITVHAEDVVLVTTQSFLLTKESTELIEILHNYHLIPKIDEKKECKKS